jgi:sensor c-di-GMP phosphodiesterase-like protein
MINLDAIRAGLTQGEFFLEYLPTVSLTDGRCIGAEALIRWRRATGVVPPGDFKPGPDR